MSGDHSDPAADGGVRKEDIFGTGEGTRQPTEPAKERLRRLYDLYVRSPLSIAWSDWRTRTGGIIMIFFILVGTVGTWLVPRTEPIPQRKFLSPFTADSTQDISVLDFPLGADHIGRGVLSETVHATPGMLLMIFAGVVIAISWGAAIGLISGYKGGQVDRVMMTATDTFLVLPPLPFIIVLTAIYPPQEPILVGAMIAVVYFWAPLAREVRSQVLTIRSEDYVEAARAMGLGTPTIIGQEILPKLAPYALMRGALAGRQVVFVSVALFFIGILPGGAAENWGVMLNLAWEQQAHLLFFQRGHTLVVPLIALSLVTFGLVLFSQGLDRVFNPRLRARHAKTVAEGDGEEV